MFCGCVRTIRLQGLEFLQNVKKIFETHAQPNKSKGKAPMMAMSDDDLPVLTVEKVRAATNFSPFTSLANKKKKKKTSTAPSEWK